MGVVDTTVSHSEVTMLPCLRRNTVNTLVTVYADVWFIYVHFTEFLKIKKKML